MPTRSLALTLTATAALLASGAPLRATEPAPEETFLSVPVARIAIDLGEPGPGLADLSFSDHDLQRRDAIVGASLAANLVAGPPLAGGRPEGVTSRIGVVSFELPEGDLLVLGTSFGTDAAVVPGGGQTLVDAPQVRAIIGGTGDRAGASGELVTVRRPDDLYERTIRPPLPEPPEDLVLEGRLVGDVPADLGAAGASPGDLLLHRADLLRDGLPAGERLSVRIVAATEAEGPGAALAIVVYRLAEGEIVALGRIPATDMPAPDGAMTRRMAIVGGTGAYAGARGELTLTLLGDGRTENRLAFLRATGAPGPVMGGALSWTEVLAGEDPSGGASVRVAAPPAGDGSPGVAVAWSDRRGAPDASGDRHHLLLAVLPLPDGDLVLGGTFLPGDATDPADTELALLGGTGAYAGLSGILRLTDPAAARLDGEVVTGG